jgi:hypothetical protein
MPYAPLNILLEKDLPPKGAVSLRYPEGRNEGHFFGGMNHTLSIDGVFFRSPRDFILLTHQDHIVFTWNGAFPLPAGLLLNIQAEIPGGDFYFDPKSSVTVLNMVHSPLFMVNLGSPADANPVYWVDSTTVSDNRPLKLAYTQTLTARNVVIHAENDNSHATFTVEGEDLYRRSMVETITLSALPSTEGKKAFSYITRITSNFPCNGKISLGTGNKLGLPVFLPSVGYLIREIVNGQPMTGGIVAAGETAAPFAASGDRRGTYTPPPGIALDGRKSVHLLLSLLAPGNIGIPDFTG